MKTSELEQLLDEILFGKEEAPPQKRKRGRARKEKPPIWSLEFYEPSRNTTFALISMCIKDDFSQSLEELAIRLAAYKSRPPRECLAVLRKLRSCGRLGYYDQGRMFRTWHGEEDPHGLESLCG